MVIAANQQSTTDKSGGALGRYFRTLDKKKHHSFHSGDPIFPENIRDALAPTDFESRDSSGHGASQFEFRWMAPPIGIANMPTAATEDAGRSTYTGDEERTFEKCVEEAWKLDVYSSSEAETSTVGRSGEEETDTPLSDHDSHSEADVLAAKVPSGLQTTALFTRLSGPRWRSGRTLGDGTKEMTK
jgi:hypothetical protein